MSSTNRDYELNILKMAINKELDNIAVPTEENLSFFESNVDQIVWDLATKIYNQSGHRVELSMARDLVVTRINSIKQIIHNQNQAKKQIEQQLKSVNESTNLEYEISHVLNVCGGNKDKARIFIRVRNVIIEQLSVNKERVHWNSHISNDLMADELDTINLLLLLDDEFDVELDIPEDMLGSVEKWPPSYTWSGSFRDSVPVACTVGELTDFIYRRVTEEG